MLSGRNNLPYERAPWLFHTKWLALKQIHTNNIIQTKQVTFRYIYFILIYTHIYIHTYMHITTSNEKRDQEFEREQGGLGGRKGRGNNVIIV